MSINSLKKPEDIKTILEYLVSSTAASMKIAKSFVLRVLHDAFVLMDITISPDTKAAEAKVQEFVDRMTTSQSATTEEEIAYIIEFIEKEYVDPPEGLIYAFSIAYENRAGRRTISTEHIRLLTRLFKEYTADTLTTESWAGI